MKKILFRFILPLWLAWVLIVIGFQALATARFLPQWPDRAQEWTEQYTGSNYQKGDVYLLDPFMNNQVAWDSEYYLGIASGGYNDPRIPTLTTSGNKIPTNEPGINLKGSYSLSYAFFPLYPWTMWLIHWPLKIFRLDPIATSTLAGVIVSAFGTLAAMLSLYDLTRDPLGEDGAMRTVFYLLIFPTGFFLVQVYSEGLFVGLAFGCLAMLKRRQWVIAALLGAAAALTRAVGVALVIPMVIAWIRSEEWTDIGWQQIFSRGIPWLPFGRALLMCSPLIVFLIWKFSYLGSAFDYVEGNFFRREVLNLGSAFHAWSEAYQSMFIGNPERTAYYITEFIGLLIGLVTCVACLKYDFELTLFSLAVFIISWGSGPAQGIQRYILAAPAVFIMLARWGKNPIFDRVWTIISLLLMGLLATLFAFNYWVA